MLEVLNVIQPSQVVKVTETLVTITCVDPAGLICQLPDGSTRPAQVGDVLSMQPDGTVQTRPAGADGPYELAVMSGTLISYNPQGPTGSAYALPYAQQVPNQS